MLLLTQESGGAVMEWLKNDEHIIFLLSGCIFIIVIQGIIIFKLSQYKSAEEKERDCKKGKLRDSALFGVLLLYMLFLQV